MLIVRILAFIRLVLSIIYLTVTRPSYEDVNDGMRTRLMALGILAALLGSFDWIPYRIYTWQRQPKAITKIMIPTLGTASISINTALFLMDLLQKVHTVDSPEGLTEPFFPSEDYFADEERSEAHVNLVITLLSLCFTIASAVVTSAGIYYFVHYEPLRLPRVYEPICEGTGCEQNGTSPAFADSSPGPCARLYQAQLSSARSDEGRRQDDEENQQSTRTRTEVSENFNRA